MLVLFFIRSKTMLMELLLYLSGRLDLTELIITLFDMKPNLSQSRFSGLPVNNAGINNTI
jgi:hypothetical protein